MKIKQIILVKTKGSSCRIYFMEKHRSGFVCVLRPINGYVGRGGIVPAPYKREGDGKTPLGLYPIGRAFGLRRTRTGLDRFDVTAKSRWCCDTNSRYYNRYSKKRWLSSCEDMWKYKKEYKYGAVIEYNPSGEEGKGSAIFFHCKNSPTSGCVAAAEQDVKRILARLDKRKNPHILIK